MRDLAPTANARGAPRGRGGVDPRYILSIDTSSAWLCVAVSNKERVVASYCRKQERGHGKHLVPVIARLFKRSRIAPAHLNGLGVVNGPGSFTGLRIGLATAKGLAMALDIPVVLLASLDVLAQGAKCEAAVIMPLIDARRQQVYAAIYRLNTKQELTRRSPFLLGQPHEIMKRITGAVIIPGDGAAVFAEELRRSYPQAEFLPDSFSRPQPQVLARLAYREHVAGNAVEASAVSARYLYKDTCAVRVPGHTKSSSQIQTGNR